jgi:hypothetical protein
VSRIKVIAASVPCKNKGLEIDEKRGFSLEKTSFPGVKTWNFRLCPFPDKTARRVVKIPQHHAGKPGLCRVCRVAGQVSSWYGHCR